MNNQIETILYGFQDWPTEGIAEWLLRDTQQKFTSTQNEQPGGLTPPSSKAFRFSIAVWHSALPSSELSLIPCAAAIGTQTQTRKGPIHALLGSFCKAKSCGSTPVSSAQDGLLLAVPNSVSWKMTFC